MAELFDTGLRAYLTGAWRIAREIEDRRAGGAARFEGTGTFAPDGNGLLYRERGILSVGGPGHVAERAYRWRFPGPWTAEVAFDDGRDFHRVEVAGGEATAHHHCPPDDYRVRYRFDAPDAWEQVWTVHGPRKDYTARSRFTRLHSAAHPVQSARETRSP